MMEFTEGKVTIRVPAFEKITSKSPVFYNPSMAFDRKLSVEVMKATGNLHICDAFSGSGIRAILYAAEGGEVTACDVNERAVELIRENAALNGVPLTIVREDANTLLRRERFDIVDVDPFGSPARYLDSVMNALKTNSYLFVTATDTETLCGYAKKAALRRYGIRTGRTPFPKEFGVRVLLTAIVREGAKWGYGFSVLLTYWRQHYIRVFLKAHHNKKAAFSTMNQVHPLFFCECGWFSTDITETCPICRRKAEYTSPLYMGTIKENAFLDRIEMKELVEDLKKEVDTPFYYDTHFLSRYHKFQPPKVDVVVAKLRENFSASRTLFSPTAVKTDAPLSAILDTIVKENEEKLS